MFLDYATFLQGFENSRKNETTKIRLSDIFSDYLVDGKLLLQGIDFYRMSPWFQKIDFADCEITQCNFSGMILTHNDFRNCRIAEDNLIENMVIHKESNKGLEFLPLQWQPQVVSNRNYQEYNSLANQAQHFWMKELWEKNPEDLFVYETLKDRAIGSQYICEMSKWFIFAHPKLVSPLDTASEEADFFGWKLHLSVSQKDIKTAFSLVAPIISRYCPTFKVINADTIENDDIYSKEEFNDTESNKYLLQMEKKYPIKAHSFQRIREFHQDLLRRGREGMQFAIYLQHKGEILVTPEDAEKMVAEVTSTLQNANISPGLIPFSDMRTTSPYFSMRNDMVKIWHSNGFVRNYLSAAESYRNPNPGNSENIYSNLQEEKYTFDLLRYFESLPPCTSFSELEKNLDFSLLAFLREYTLIDSFDFEEMNDFTNICEKVSSPELPNIFLKKEYYDNNGIKYMVKRAGLLVEYLKYRKFQEPQDFLLHYPHQDIFASHMKKINASLNEFMLEQEAYPQENSPEHVEETLPYENFDAYINQMIDWEKQNLEADNFYDFPDEIDNKYNFSSNDGSDDDDEVWTEELVTKFTELLQKPHIKPLFQSEPKKAEEEESKKECTHLQKFF